MSGFAGGEGRDARLIEDAYESLGVSVLPPPGEFAEDEFTAGEEASGVGQVDGRDSADSAVEHAVAGVLTHQQEQPQLVDVQQFT